MSALGGKVLPEPGVLWEEEGEDNVAPDVAVVLADRLGIVQEKIRGAPNLVVEILSTGIEARRRDLEAKRDLYLRRGVVEYWVIELDARCLRRMTRGLSDWVEQVLSEADVVRTSLLPEWEGTHVRSLLP